MTGKVCAKHQEWCPTGECRWCEPEPVKVLPAPEVPSFAKAAQAMIAAAQARILSQPPPTWVRPYLIPHYPACPLKGAMDPDQSKDLAAGCTCVPFP